METLHMYMGVCSPRSCDSIKVCELHNFATPTKAAFVAHEKDLVHLQLSRPEALKPKERIKQFF